MQPLTEDGSLALERRLAKGLHPLIWQGEVCTYDSWEAQRSAGNNMDPQIFRDIFRRKTWTNMEKTREHMKNAWKNMETNNIFWMVQACASRWFHVVRLDQDDQGRWRKGKAGNSDLVQVVYGKMTLEKSLNLFSYLFNWATFVIISHV